MLFTVFIKLISEWDGISSCGLTNDCFCGGQIVSFFAISVVFFVCNFVWSLWALQWFCRYHLSIVGRFGGIPLLDFLFLCTSWFTFMFAWGVCQMVVVVINMYCVEIKKFQSMTSSTFSSTSIWSLDKASLINSFLPCWYFQSNVLSHNFSNNAINPFVAGSFFPFCRFSIPMWCTKTSKYWCVSSWLKPLM